jgi:hypothetical protein
METGISLLQKLATNIVFISLLFYDIRENVKVNYYVSLTFYVLSRFNGIRTNTVAFVNDDLRHEYSVIAASYSVPLFHATAACACAM